MYYYLVCRFLQENKLSPKAYIYSVSKENYDKVKIGYRYKIKNSDGYDYRGSSIEITGKYRASFEKVVCEDFLVSLNNSFNNYFPIKNLVKLDYVSKHPYADYFQDIIEPNESASIKTPIIYHGEEYSCIGDLPVPVKTGTIFFGSNKASISKMENKENKAMNKIFGNVEFGKYTGRDIKMSVGGLAYRAEDNKYVAYDENKLALTDVTDFVFDVDGFLYLLPVAVKDVQVGDIIRNNNSYVIVKDIAGGNFIEVIDPSTNELKTIMPVHNIFGFDFYTKVVSLMSADAFGPINEDNPFGSMLSFFLLNQNNGIDTKTLMLMSMMNGKSFDFQNNPWLMIMMLDNKGDMDSLLPLVMMSNGGFNFGAKKTNDCEKENKKS